MKYDIVAQFILGQQKRRRNTQNTEGSARAKIWIHASTERDENSKNIYKNDDYIILVRLSHKYSGGWSTEDSTTWRRLATTKAQCSERFVYTTYISRRAVAFLSTSHTNYFTNTYFHAAKISNNSSMDRSPRLGSTAV